MPDFKKGFSGDKPSFPDDYCEWMDRELSFKIDALTRHNYESVANAIQANFNGSPIWQSVSRNLSRIDDEYRLSTNRNLMMSFAMPNLFVKPYESFLSKTYRYNVLKNDRFPNPPRNHITKKNEWITPRNWYSDERMNDIVRTMFIVKYLDGVPFFGDHLSHICKTANISEEIKLLAWDTGYCAGHFYVPFSTEVPAEVGTQVVTARIEIQITTQIKELLNELTHKEYERSRMVARDSNEKWQWDYKSDGFQVNYLGHIAHYLEGVIIQLLDKKKGAADES
jgi:hypothetical protein